MKMAIVLSVVLAGGVPFAFGQASGNIGYSQAGGKARAEQNERSKRTVLPAETPASNTMFLEASVLMNVKADEYVALFAVAREAGTVVECNQKMDAVLADFLSALRPLGVAPE
jgi:hypothetical protein